MVGGQRFVVLNAAADNVLCRLHHCKYLLGSQQRPDVLSDVQYAKLVKAALSAFPEEVPAQTPGLDVFTSRAATHKEQLGVFYDAFVSLMDFREKALTTLELAAAELKLVDVVKNPLLVLDGFCRLVVNYIRVTLMFALIAERKQITSLYTIAFEKVKSAKEDHWKRLSTLIETTWVPLRQLQKEFADHVAPLVADIVMRVDLNELDDVDKLRQAGTYAVLSNVGQLSAPAAEDLPLMLGLRSEFLEWSALMMLCTPAEFARPELLARLQYVLRNLLVCVVHREERISIHEEFESLFANYKTATLKLSAHKKDVSAASAAFGDVVALRKRRRVFLFQEAYNLLCVLNDSPQVVAPKFPLLVSLLWMCRAEVVWSALHSGRQAPKKAAKFAQDDILSTCNALVDVTQRLRQFVMKNFSLVQRYFVESVSGPDAVRLKAAVGSIKKGELGSDVSLREQLTLMLEGAALPSVSAVESGKVPSLESLRLAWLRSLGRISRLTSLDQDSDELLMRGNRLYMHSRMVDELESVVFEASNLALLWVESSLPDSWVAASLSQRSSCPQACLAIIATVADTPTFGTPSVEDERARLGNHATRVAERLVDIVVKSVTDLLTTLRGSGYYGGLRERLLPESTASLFAARSRQAQGAGGAASASTMPGGAPGTESQYEHAQQIAGLAEKQMLLEEILQSFANFSEFVVYRTAFNTGASLLEHLKGWIGNTLVQSVAPRQDKILRPSVLRESVVLLAELTRMIEDVVRIPVGSAFAHMFLEQCVERDGVDVGPVISKSYNDTVATLLAKWYLHFVEKRLLQPGIMYSPNRRSFVTVKLGMFSSVEFVAEQFVDVSEIRALVELVGVFGVRVLEKQLLVLIVSKLRLVRGLLDRHQATLARVLQLHAWPNEEQWLRATLGTDIDTFSSLMVHVGLILALRAMIFDALDFVTRRNAPLLSETLQAAMLHVPPLGASSSYQELEQVALEMGQRNDGADIDLRTALEPLLLSANDWVAWSMLPAMVACTLHSDMWKQADYRLSYEAFVNNMHMLMPAFVSVTVGLCAVQCGEASASMQDVSGVCGLAPSLFEAVRQQLLMFLNGASVLLLHMMDARPGAPDIAMRLIFVDRIMEITTLVAPSDVEDVLPYTLLRSTYLQMYREQKKELALLKRGGGHASAAGQ